MFIKISRISIVNSEINVSDLADIPALKKELSERLNVKTADIHFEYEEIKEFLNSK